MKIEVNLFPVRKTYHLSVGDRVKYKKHREKNEGEGNWKYITLKGVITYVHPKGWWINIINEQGTLDNVHMSDFGNVEAVG